MNSGLEGKGALVAGASAGIGLAIARGLAREGARVAIVARRREVLEDAARSIRTETGAEVVPIVCDLTERAAVADCIRRAAEAVGGIEVLVTNAGGPRSGGFQTYSSKAPPLATIVPWCTGFSPWATVTLGAFLAESRFG